MRAAKLLLIRKRHLGESDGIIRLGLVQALPELFHRLVVPKQIVDRDVAGQIEFVTEQFARSIDAGDITIRVELRCGRGGLNWYTRRLRLTVLHLEGVQQGLQVDVGHGARLLCSAGERSIRVDPAVTIASVIGKRVVRLWVKEYVLIPRSTRPRRWTDCV